MSGSTATALITGHLILLVGGILAAFFKNRPATARSVSTYTAILGSASWLLAGWLGLQSPASGTLFTIGFDWTWTWRLDSLSSLFLLVVAGAGILASAYGHTYAQEYDTRGGPVLACAYNLFLLSLGLVLTANSVLGFLLAWEFMSVTSLFLVGLDHHKPTVRQAALVYAIITHGAGALLTIAFLILARMGGLDFSNWQALHPAGWLYHFVYALFLIGFGSKAGLVPLHVWLPRAHPAAPSHVSALMSGVMVKVALYGLIRATFTWMTIPAPLWGGLLVVLGVISALTGAIYALIDQDVKGVLAYSTIENVGLLVTGIGAAILLGSGINAALALGFVLLHVVSHAVFKTLLFLGAGVVQHAAHTRRLDRLGGLVKQMPQASVLILVGILTISAVPPLAGFASEWTLMHVLFNLASVGSSLYQRVGSMLAMAAVALTAGFVAAAMVRLFGVVFLGRARSNDTDHAHEPPFAMRWPMAVLAVGCAAVGLGARPLYAFTTNLAETTLNTVTVAIFQPTIIAEPAFVGVAITLTTIFIGVLAVAWFLTRLFSQCGLPTRRSLPWGCGINLAPNMQYSALGLAEPARIIFAKLLRLRGGLVKTPDTNQNGHFRLAIPVPGEGLLYRPLRDWFVKLADTCRRLQTGSLQLYLAYLLATLVVLLMFAR